MNEAPSGRTPSGLFPGPTRPTFREPHPVRGPAFAAGLGAGALWLLLLGLLAASVRGYAWWTIVGSLAAWAVAALFTRRGDRGVAAGIATSTGIGLSVAMVVVGNTWAHHSWPLW